MQVGKQEAELSMTIMQKSNPSWTSGVQFPSLFVIIMYLETGTHHGSVAHGRHVRSLLFVREKSGNETGAQLTPAGTQLQKQRWGVRVNDEQASNRRSAHPSPSAVLSVCEELHTLHRCSESDSWGMEGQTPEPTRLPQGPGAPVQREGVPSLLMPSYS